MTNILVPSDTAKLDPLKASLDALCGWVIDKCKDRPGSLFQPGPRPGPGSAKGAGTGILPGPGL